MEMEHYKHFSHRHRLTRYNKIPYKGTCKGCVMRVLNNYYGCQKCKYYICRSCYKLPQEMRHPFHREHLLALFARSTYDDTSFNACSKEYDGFIYHCSECKFNLDVKCASLMPTTKNNYYSYASSGQSGHPHPLIPCDRENKDVDYSCSLCGLPMDGMIYACLHCQAILHKSCAQLPQQIIHQFHPYHSLTLKELSNVGSLCKACWDFNGSFHYNCSECQFSQDVRCASLTPKAIENQLDVVEQFTHPHVLIPCDINENFSFSCSACEIPIEDGTVYICLECQYILHKSCAELPRKIKHPFHPPHLLVLCDDYMEDGSYSCQACKCSVSGFYYWCAECLFAIDVACASLSCSSFKFDELHHHPLVFFNNNKRNKLSLNKCICRRRMGFPFFRCVPCNFTLKLCCHPKLPHTIKHSCHDRHSLTLTRSPIIDHSDDDSDSEYYCDLCKQRRYLYDPTYYWLFYET